MDDFSARSSKRVSQIEQARARHAGFITRSSIFLIGLALTAQPLSAKEKPADTILRNGEIYLVEPEGKWAQAVAMRDGKIAAVGSDETVSRLQGPATKVVDLHGAMAMPGIIDGHVHLGAAAADMMLYTCNFSGYSKLPEVIAAVRACARTRKPGEWIVGQYLGSSLYEQLADGTALRQLDEASGEHPVMLRNDTIHDRWVNSRALEIAGINEKTPDPKNGKIGRDPRTGALNGLLLEWAGNAVEEKIPKSSDAASVDSLRFGVRYLNSIGVTGFLDAGVVMDQNATFSNSESYHRLDQAGELTAHAGMSMVMAFASGDMPTDAELDKIYAAREAVRSSRLSMDFAKVFVDGVMVSHTSVFLDPYVPDAAHGANFRGKPNMSPESLAALVTKLDARGISVKMHVSGDGAVRMALDAIAAARAANGNSGPIHTLAHAGYISPADIPRLRTLRAAVDASPTVWYPGPILTATEAVIGKARADRYWPFKTFVRSGATVVGGTDWKTLPGEFSSLWDGMQGMVTRENPTGQAPGALWPEEAVDVPTMIRFYTLNGAKVLGIDKSAGSIAVGKSADIIVLDKNLFKIPASAISTTKVVKTFFQGRIVYDRDGAAALEAKAQ